MIPSKKAWISSMTYPLLVSSMFLFYVLSASRNFGDVKAAAVLRPVVELYFQEVSVVCL
jgi:hypothetical protein